MEPNVDDQFHCVDSPIFAEWMLPPFTVILAVGWVTVSVAGQVAEPAVPVTVPP